eukprot:364326-Chlamydomonas_euryale.AAC.19
MCAWLAQATSLVWAGMWGVLGEACRASTNTIAAGDNEACRWQRCHSVGRKFKFTDFLGPWRNTPVVLSAGR